MSEKSKNQRSGFVVGSELIVGEESPLEYAIGARVRDEHLRCWWCAADRPVSPVADQRIETNVGCRRAAVGIKKSEQSSERSTENKRSEFVVGAEHIVAENDREK